MSTYKKPRRPREGNAIARSLLRPHVRADQRLLAWSTPYSLHKRNELQSRFGELDARAVLEVRLFSLELKTRSNYAAGLLRFTQYCDSRGIPEWERMPASEDLLSAFITAMAAGKVGKSTLENWLSGVASWHALFGAPWLGDKALKMTKAGVVKLAPASSTLPKRPPVTIEHMHALRRGLNLSNTFDSAVWAIATAVFWSCCRLGELTIPSADAFDRSRHVTQENEVTFRTLPGGQQTACFHIPWSKTTHLLGADIIITGNSDISDPYNALMHHVRVNRCTGTDRHSTPLFAFKTSDGSFVPMTKAWFMSKCERVWAANGLPLMHGHGFRIGGATELLLRGVPPNVVQVQGRWKSQAFLEYWRKIESVLPLFISDSFQASRAALVAETMTALCRKKTR